MIRNLLLAVVFFFGPALLLFMLRNALLLLRLWLRRRRQEPKVIDVTPVEGGRAPLWFYLLAGLTGLAAAVSVFMYLQQTQSQVVRQYVPAHIGEDGRIVPGHWIDKQVNPK